MRKLTKFEKNRLDVIKRCKKLLQRPPPTLKEARIQWEASKKFRREHSC